MSANAYLADIAEQSSLAIRLTILAGLVQVSNILSQMAAALLTARLSMAYVVMIGQSFLVLAFFYALVFVK